MVFETKANGFSSNRFHTIAQQDLLTTAIWVGFCLLYETVWKLLLAVRKQSKRGFNRL